MGWGLAAMAAMSYLQSRQQQKSDRAMGQPLPTYYKYLQSPQQKEMYGMMQPTMQNLFTQGGPAPTAGWYGGLDPNIRAGIEEPYMRGMDMMRSQLQGGGQLGAPRAGMSGAAADVFGQYMQKAAPSMAQTGWNMMLPGMMLPYQTGAMMMPGMMPEMLVGHTPTIQEAGTQPLPQSPLGGSPYQQQPPWWQPEGAESGAGEGAGFGGGYGGGRGSEYW